MRAIQVIFAKAKVIFVPQDNNSTGSSRRSTAGNTSASASAKKPNATEPINVPCVTVTMEEPHALVVRDPIQPTLVQPIPGLNQQLTLPTPVTVNLLTVYLDGYDQEQRSY